MGLVLFTRWLLTKNSSGPSLWTSVECQEYGRSWRRSRHTLTVANRHIPTKIFRRRMRLISMVKIAVASNTCSLHSRTRSHHLPRVGLSVLVTKPSPTRTMEPCRRATVLCVVQTCLAIIPIAIFCEENVLYLPPLDL